MNPAATLIHDEPNVFRGCEIKVEALVITTVPRAGGGLAAGFLSPWQVAYDVIYICPTGACDSGCTQYQRIGMGYLWGREMKKVYGDKPKRRALYLV
jgi:hypothetical protein